ncbi:hypothetical protein Ancab_022945 [Ancistrocladus abbreviatus]
MLKVFQQEWHLMLILESPVPIPLDISSFQACRTASFEMKGSHIERCDLVVEGLPLTGSMENEVMGSIVKQIEFLVGLGSTYGSIPQRYCVLSWLLDS